MRCDILYLIKVKLMDHKKGLLILFILCHVIGTTVQNLNTIPVHQSPTSSIFIGNHFEQTLKSVDIVYYSVALLYILYFSMLIVGSLPGMFLLMLPIVYYSQC